MKLSVIIVSYNVKYYLGQCIDSVLRAAKGIETEIFVVDNHSADGSVEYLQLRFGNRITLIDSNRNLGFAKANNLAISKSVGDYVLLLNPDTFVSEDALRLVIDFMDTHEKAGACGLRMHNADGSVALESRRGLPTPLVSFLKMIGFSSRYYMKNLSWNNPEQIEVISGAFFMMRRQSLEQVGMLDEDFFMYGEDIDLSYRFLKNNWQNWYVPADILHYKGESTQKTSFRYVHVFYQAMLIFFRKHYSHFSLLVSLPIKTAIYMKAALALFHISLDMVRNTLGFANHKETSSRYVFWGSDTMLSECRVLAGRKGLDAVFVSEDKSIDDIEATHVVYDSETMGFGRIISTAASARKCRAICTYSSRTKLLITPTEIFKV